ncbi:MAG: hypothetical protein RMK99_04905 [Anaerolineales bacterium]|nr:hypothetical protein [Anaerolineales bacterium]
MNLFPSSFLHIWNSRPAWAHLLLAGVLLVIAVGLFLWAAQFLPLDDVGYGADWRNVFWGAWQSGSLKYSPGLNNPPWTMWLVWPFALLPFRISWALWTLLTVVVLVLSVPPCRDGRANIWLTLALLLSFWTIRLLVEGNLAALVVGGVLLIMNGLRHPNPWALVFGILLATAKVQESWLLLLMLVWQLLKSWPIQRLLMVGAGVAGLILPSMLVSGSDWLASAFGAEGSFLSHAARTTGNAGWLGIARWAEISPFWTWFVWLAMLATTVWLGQLGKPTLSREKAGFLIAASMLLSPYTGGASLAVLATLGLVPLWQRRFWPGLGLWLLSSSPYLSLLFNSRSGWVWPDWVQLVLIFMTWAALGYDIWQMESRILKSRCLSPQSEV